MTTLVISQTCDLNAAFLVRLLTSDALSLITMVLTSIYFTLAINKTYYAICDLYDALALMFTDICDNVNNFAIIVTVANVDQCLSFKQSTYMDGFAPNSSDANMYKFDALVIFTLILI